MAFGDGRLSELSGLGIKRTYLSTVFGASSLKSSIIMRPEAALESNSINTRGRTIRGFLQGWDY